MDIPSYKNQTFIIEDNESRIRLDDLKTPAKYKSGDTIPPDKGIGDFKIIPKRTEVFIVDTKEDRDKNVFVFAQPVNNDPEIPSGWTKPTNLKGRFLNELLGFAPSEWILPPDRKHFTVTDDHAYIRNGPPDFEYVDKSIPKNTFVFVKEENKEFVKVSYAVLNGNPESSGDEIGWTKISNLTDGLSEVFKDGEWSDHKGPIGCWDNGKFLGLKTLVNIVGTGNERKQITFDSLEPYLRLKNAAAEDNFELTITSGFRTYGKQEYLFHEWQQTHKNIAAQPGYSDHQHGQAFDFNVPKHDITPLYVWLTKNAPKLGFLRTVSSENWHWEFLPKEAAVLSKVGKFSTF